MATGESFTTSYPNLSAVLNNTVEIEAETGGQSASQKIGAKALWDTGATITAVKPDIAAKLGLKTISIVTITTPSGIKDCNVYAIKVTLPNDIEMTYIKAVEAYPANCDILIGMDIIGKGDFAVTNFGGETVFTFRTPPKARIDFTQ